MQLRCYILGINASKIFCFLSGEAARPLRLSESDGGQAFYKIVKRCETILLGAQFE